MKMCPEYATAFGCEAPLVDDLFIDTLTGSTN